LGYVLGDNGMGWIQLPDGRLLCRRCSEAADCPTTGHQMSSWSWYPHPNGRGPVATLHALRGSARGTLRRNGRQLMLPAPYESRLAPEMQHMNVAGDIVGDHARRCVSA